MGQPVERVWAAGMQMQFGGHAGSAETTGVIEVFVAKDVQIADIDVGVGQA